MNKSKCITIKKKNKNSLAKWRDKGICNHCGTNKRLTIHHIIPKRNGGKNTRSNLMILCRHCHDIVEGKIKKKKEKKELIIKEKIDKTEKQIKIFLDSIPNDYCFDIYLYEDCYDADEFFFKQSSSSFL